MMLGCEHLDEYVLPEPLSATFANKSSNWRKPTTHAKLMKINDKRQILENDITISDNLSMTNVSALILVTLLNSE